MKRIYSQIFKSILILSITSCAYFNTFYNANLFFEEAEQLREEQKSDGISILIKNKYKDVIDKCDIVINKYAKSRYVDDAYLLRGKAYYYIGEFEEAENSFRSLLQIDQEKHSSISNYWLALIKWQRGRPQPALNDLDALLQNSTDDKYFAKIYESKADIYLDTGQDSDAMAALEKAADLTKNRIDKGNIYYELALLADKINNNEQAIEYYENTIKYSYSSDRILESHLRIVQLYRDLQQYKEASIQINDMLNDPSFVAIYPDLNLELAKLELAQDNKETGVSILNDIVVKFPKTEVSAESFYLLGNEYLFNFRDFSKADYSYQQVIKEFNATQFKQPTDLRLKEISNYNKSLDYILSLKKDDNTDDSLNFSLDTTKIISELYNLGEIEAFHFNELDTSLIYFNRIIEDYPGSDLEPKVLYALSVINQNLGNSSKSIEYEERIILDYPNTDFAEYIRSTDKSNIYGKSSLEVLHEAEQLYLINEELALTEYKSIAYSNSQEASARAMLFIANEYEKKYFDADSSKKYYELVIQKYPRSLQAELAQDKLASLNLIPNKDML